MKHKLLAIIIVAALLLGLLGNALASTITITDGNENAGYVAYRLLDLYTEQDPELCDVPTHTHTQACYAHYYSVNDKYLDILLDLTGLDTTDLTDDEISDALVDYIRDGGATIRQIADTIYALIKAAELPFDLEATDAVFDSVPQGYYLIIETTPAGVGETVSKAMLDTMGQLDLEIMSKDLQPPYTPPPEDPNPYKPDIVKYVGGAMYETDKRVTSASLSERVYFTIKTSNMLENTEMAYGAAFTLYDAIPAGLTYVSGTLRIRLYRENGTTYSRILSSGDFTLTVNEDGTSSLVVYGRNETTKYVSWEYTYAVTLNENVLVGEANANRAYLEYPSDPYDPAARSVTQTRKACVYTFTLRVLKTNYDETLPLPGAKFLLYRYNASSQKEYYVSGGNWTTNRNAARQLTSDDEGLFEANLAEGTFYLEEIYAPAGYTLLGSDVQIILDATFTDQELTQLLLTVNSEPPASCQNGIAEVLISDTAGTIMPDAGGIGTTLFYIIGAALMLLSAAAIVFVIARKKKRAAGQ